MSARICIRKIRFLVLQKIPTLFHSCLLVHMGTSCHFLFRPTHPDASNSHKHIQHSSGSLFSRVSHFIKRDFYNPLPIESSDWHHSFFFWYGGCSLIKKTKQLSLSSVASCFKNNLDRMRSAFGLKVPRNGDGYLVITVQSTL